MNAVQFSILNWSAWAPGLITRDQWQEWSSMAHTLINDDGSTPALKQVPAMLRRRLSRLSKMSLQVVYECIDNTHDIRTVFCSSHGEIHRTSGLLDDIIAGEKISPMGFSLSVHNTASGLYSIASENKAASTAIAAGKDTLEMAVIEAVGRLQQNAESPVLVVLAEEPLPECYKAFDSEPAVPFALSLLLGDGNMSHGESINMSLQAGERVSTKDCSVDTEFHGLSFLRFLLGNKTELTTFGELSQWHWRKSDD